MKNKTLKTLIKTMETPWSLTDEQTAINGTTKKITEYCCNLPKPLKKITLVIIDAITISVSRIIRIFSQFSLTMYYIQGKEKNTGTNFEILLISNGNQVSYLLKNLFSGKPKIIKTGKINLWNIKKIDYSNIDAVFIKTDRFYSHTFEKNGYTIIPEWIKTTLDVTEPWKQIYRKFTKSAKDDIRKVKKYGYTYEISQDPEKLKTFYNQMYIPYTSQRHGETALYANYQAIRHMFEKNNKLMLIKHNNEDVYGALFNVKKNQVVATYAGLMDGKTKLLKKGVGASPYYFLIQWAKENNIKTIDFGTCRAFLKDGTYRYKKKWGTQIGKTESTIPGIYAFKTFNNEKAIQGFLLNNPFISSNNNELNLMTYEQK